MNVEHTRAKSTSNNEQIRYKEQESNDLPTYVLGWKYVVSETLEKSCSLPLGSVEIRVLVPNAGVIREKNSTLNIPIRTQIRIEFLDTAFSVVATKENEGPHGWRVTHGDANVRVGTSDASRVERLVEVALQELASM